MKKFKIITDTCSALERNLREKYEIEYIPMSINVNGKMYDADLDWKEISMQNYYDTMRNNNRILTSQITKPKYIDVFENEINNGFDILYIGCSSALSGSVQASYSARDELKSKYPEANIVCVDSLISGLGLGYLTIMASELRKQGKNIEEVAEYIEKNKLKVHQWGTVGDLKFLKWSGRIKATTALFGTILNIKPIIISDAKGANVSVEKVKGRSKAVEKLATSFEDNYNPNEFKDVFIAHADCLQDAESLKEKILSINPNVNVHLGYVDPIVGASAGPDTLLVYFVGDKVTYEDN